MRGLSVGVRLIAASTALLVVVVGLFAIMNSFNSRRLVDDSARRLESEISAGLAKAGTAQLQLLAEATRIALLQSDYTTLQTTVANMARHDESVVAAAVVDPSGSIIAHSDAKLVNPHEPVKATGHLAESIKASSLTTTRSIEINGQKCMTFAIPVENSGSRLCTVFLAYSLVRVDAELKKAAQLKKTEVAAILRNTIALGALSLLLGILLTIFQGLRISRPIQALARQADQIAGGDLQARVQIKSKDEIGLLGDRFNFMAEQVLHLMHATMEKASMEKELEVASAVQATLLPDAAEAHISGMSLAAYFKPATKCGGDWWTYCNMADGKLLILIGDVTGHGVGSAMITAAAKGASTTVMELTSGSVDLRTLLRAMNAAIHSTAKDRFVMTCFASIYDPRDMTLTFANAGHNFPYLVEGATGKLSSLIVRGNRLGDMDRGEYEVRSIQVKPNDTLVWYTDGIVECENARGEEYGEKRFRSSVARHASLPARDARNAVVQSANEFFGDVPQKDDITLIIGKLG